MNTTTKVMAVLGLLAVGGFAWVRAGNIDPPTGAVQGTMHTLDEIYGLLAQGGKQGSAGRWKYRQIPGSESGTTIVAPSAGVLHGVLLFPCNCGSTKLYDATSTDVSSSPMIAEVAHYVGSEYSAGSTSVFIPLDIEFEHGLVFVPPPNATQGPVTLIFRID